MATRARYLTNPTSKILSRCSKALVVLLSVSTAVHGEDVFKRVDENGRVVYSTQSSSHNEKPVELPKVQRENIDRRLEVIKEVTFETCDKHGGIDCKQGADADGSVVCIDGFRGSGMMFSEQCLEARLQVSPLVFETMDGKKLSFKKLFTEENYSRIPETLTSHISIRNLSSIEAQHIEVHLPVGTTDFPASGPHKVEAYGVADYILSVDKQALLKRKVMMLEPRLIVECRNCSAVLSAPQ